MMIMETVMMTMKNGDDTGEEESNSYSEEA